MPSITTQTIGTAASADTTALNRTTPAAKGADTTPTPGQVAQASQASSQQATVVAKTDKERAPQNPKRTEGGFGSQEEKGSRKKSGTKGAPQSSTTVDSVDIIA